MVFDCKSCEELTGFEPISLCHSDGIYLLDNDSPSLLIMVVADSTLRMVSTLFPADHKSFDDFFLPLANALILQKDIAVIKTLILCLNLLFNSLRTSQFPLCFVFLSPIMAIGTPVNLVVVVMSPSPESTIASL